MVVVDEVPWSRVCAYQLPMGVGGVLSHAGLSRIRPVLLRKELAHLSHEQCAGQARRKSAPCPATGSLHPFSAHAKLMH